jgi:hypothetical protein
MLSRSHIKKVSFAALFILGVQVALAITSTTTTTGTVDERFKDKYSLNNLNAFSRKTISLSLNNPFQFKGSVVLNQKTSSTGTTETRSILQFDRGNTSYAIPFKFKVKVSSPKFKTPTKPVN